MKKRGAVIVLLVTLIVVVSLVFVAAGVAPAMSSRALAKESLRSVQTGALAESSLEDVLYRVNTAKLLDTTETLFVGGVNATTTVSDDILTGIKTLAASSTASLTTRRKSINLTQSETVNFNYGAQVGDGGISMDNSATIIGGVYSNGSITGSGNTIQGTVVSAGSSGLIDDIYATSSAYANDIQDSTVDVDAYYQSISNTTVNGTSYPGSADQPTQSLPMTDEQLDAWEEAAEDAQVITDCDYEIDEDETIGPAKIDCNLKITGKPTVTLTGNLWVKGDIEIENSAELEIDSSLAGTSVVIIAHDPADESGKGQIKIKNSASFTAAADGDAIFLISRLNDNSGRGIELENSAGGDLSLYTTNSRILLKNSTDLVLVAGYGLDLENTAKVEYKEGLSSAVFSSGAGGSWQVQTWREVE